MPSSYPVFSAFPATAGTTGPTRFLSDAAIGGGVSVTLSGTAFIARIQISNDQPAATDLPAAASWETAATVTAADPPFSRNGPVRWCRVIVDAGQVDGGTIADDNSRRTVTTGSPVNPLFAQPVGFAAFGDSIMDRYSNAPTNLASSGWPNLVSVANAGLALMQYNGGVQGQTSAQVLARVLPALKTLQTAAVPIRRSVYGEQINDQAASVPWATTKANHVAFVQICWRLGIEPIIILGTPTNNFDFRAQNADLAGTMAALGVTVIDAFTPLASVSGGLAAAYNGGDGVHPSDAGMLLIAQTAAPVLASGAKSGPYLATTATDGSNLVVNPLFTGAATAGLPNDWADAGFGGATATYSLNAATTGRGNRFRITKTSTGSTTKDIFKQAAAVTVGRRYAIDFEFSADASQVGFTYRTVLTWVTSGGAAIGSSFAPILDWTLTLANGVSHYEAVAPATAANLKMELLAAGTAPGWFEIGALTIRDLG